ncbi:MAG TPA: ABC transporter substrate-binding protein [Alphaproteobacteria bacterium]|nr:ABC transporter substrate-binding protein [Alphaproteobacteria bacterium]
MKALRFAAGVALAGLLAAPALAQTKSVAITQIVEHPALDAARKGVQDELAAAGFTEGQNLKWSFESAQGNPATAAQIAKKFVGDRPDVIVAIATPSAQAVAANTKDIPLVFSAVTDPVGAKLVASLDKPGGNVTGTSDLLPMDQHVGLIRQLLPNAKRVGILFNPGEANSVTSVKQFTDAAKAQGITVVEGAASKSGDVLAAARSLVGKVDAIYVPTDNTVVSAFEAVVKVGTDAKLPVVAGDTDSVKRGAVAALGFDYYDVGRQTGKMVAAILKGGKPADIPVETVKKADLYLNAKTAPAMGVTLPDALLQQAKEVVK